MAYLLLRNPKLIDSMYNTGAHFFHGTNANALPSILKYGINSFDTSTENDIEVITGEEWSRFNGKRSFVSITDCLNVAMQYALEIKQNENDLTRTLLNFGVIFGVSLEDMSNIETVRVRSEMPEIGICDNLPIEHIKFIAVPEDKVEFVKKMIGQKPIEVISMDINDKFLINSKIYYMLEVLQQENKEPEKTHYPTYSEDDVKPVVYERKISKIQETLKIIKDKISAFTNSKNLDKGEER